MAPSADAKPAAPKQGTTVKKPLGVTKRRQLQRAKELDELAQLRQRIAALPPPSSVEAESFRFFRELPISRKTLDALTAAGWVEMTEIQRAALIPGLQGRDVLGAAKTGSGKTLAFVIPVLEMLLHENWNNSDGLGALILSPTRELALQIFEVLRKAGKNHTLSAGLIIGGKDLASERGRIGRINVLVATPGRLLQHMDESPNFDASALKILVLDEADRILDLGFAKAVNAIIENLPKERQTLLFSATQTKSVRDLARLSLKDPEYVAVHEKAETATPTNLQQSYMVCELPQKLNLLFSFLRTHTTSKMIVFVSSCKQVRFLFESFRKLRPGIAVMHLHGKQKQPKRMAIFYDFLRRKHACLFATDIAARGLDFPAVDWVIQLDCPEDADTYIHRVGRTARYDASGRALLFLLPSEEQGMLAALAAKKVPVTQIFPNPAKTVSIQRQLEAFCSESAELKYLAQKSFVSYMRSVFLQRDKTIFDVTKLPAEEYAASLGLIGAPRIKFVQRANALKNKPRNESAAAAARRRTGPDSSDDEALSSDSDADKARKDGSDLSSDDDSDDEAGAAAKRGSDSDASDSKQKRRSRVSVKMEKMFKRKNQDLLSEHYAKLRGGAGAADDDEEENDEGTYTVGGKGHAFAAAGSDGDDDDDDESLGGLLIKKDQPTAAEQAELDAKAALSRKKAALINKKKYQAKVGPRPTKLVFDEDGEAHDIYEFDDDRRLTKEQLAKAAEEYVESEKGRLKEADAVDKTVERARLRARRLKRKLRERGERAEHEAAGGVQLAVPDRDGDEDDEDDGGSGAESADDMSADEGGYAAPSDSDDEDEDAGTRHKGRKRVAAPTPIIDSQKRAKLAKVDPEALALQLLGGA